MKDGKYERLKHGLYILTESQLYLRRMLNKKQAMKKAQQRIENDLELLQLLNKYIKIKTAAIYARTTTIDKEGNMSMKRGHLINKINRLI